VEGLYHVWFSTKGRKPALEDEIGQEIKQLGTQTLSRAMHQLKGASARYILLKYPELRFDFGSTAFWQKGYGWRKIDPKEVHAVRHYIRTQRHRPLRRDG